MVRGGFYPSVISTHKRKHKKLLVVAIGEEEQCATLHENQTPVSVMNSIKSHESVKPSAETRHLIWKRPIMPTCTVLANAAHCLMLIILRSNYLTIIAIFLMIIPFFFPFLLLFSGFQ